MNFTPDKPHFVFPQYFYSQVSCCTVQIPLSVTDRYASSVPLEKMSSEDSVSGYSGGASAASETLVQLQLRLLEQYGGSGSGLHGPQYQQSVFYPTAPGALNVGKFPNPQAVIRLLGNNVEAQKFLSRKAQVIIRMRGLPYDATAKQVVRNPMFT